MAEDELLARTRQAEDDTQIRENGSRVLHHLLGEEEPKRRPKLEAVVDAVRLIRAQVIQEEASHVSGEGAVGLRNDVAALVAEIEETITNKGGATAASPYGEAMQVLRSETRMNILIGEVVPEVASGNLPPESSSARSKFCNIMTGVITAHRASLPSLIPVPR